MVSAVKPPVVPRVSGRSFDIWDVKEAVSRYEQEHDGFRDWEAICEALDLNWLEDKDVTNQLAKVSNQAAKNSGGTSHRDDGQRQPPSHPAATPAVEPETQDFAFEPPQTPEIPTDGPRTPESESDVTPSQQLLSEFLRREATPNPAERHVAVAAWTDSVRGIAGPPPAPRPAELPSTPAPPAGRRRRRTPPAPSPAGPVLQDLVARFVALKYPRKVVEKALQATSMDAARAGHVMEHMMAARGIPSDERGVWTSADDAGLQLHDSVRWAVGAPVDDVDEREKRQRARRELSRLTQKHGLEGIRARRKFCQSVEARGA
ncbi:hypothetical protein P8C59_008935 [Phyllachora maydis]|uniref:TRF2-interacting telomeric protein/Rap1 C-terminal domain-containing protein n=1 Tax=Phyllachora maydis TaxID=1825666 RepID=A0AAD9IDF8_9PEZI|nr:hypothetical protein P8C59_008935 [Phyllachora maydis]